MKIRSHPVLLGAFVLGALGLAITALIFLGKIHLFSRPQYLAVYFQDSVNGLEKGSPVKLQGVRVGRVDSLDVIWNLQTHHATVAVVCQIERPKVKDTQDHLLDITTPGTLTFLVQRGLRASLDLEGTTGVREVAIKLVDPEKYPAQQPPPWIAGGAEYPAIPTIPPTPSTVPGESEKNDTTTQP